MRLLIFLLIALDGPCCFAQDGYAPFEIIDTMTLRKFAKNEDSFLNLREPTVYSFCRCEIDEWMVGYEICFTAIDSSKVMTFRESFTPDFKLHRAERIK